MTLRQLTQGDRFILCRTGQVFVLIGWPRKSHAKVRLYSGRYTTLNHQCSVELLKGQDHGR